MGLGDPTYCLTQQQTQSVKAEALIFCVSLSTQDCEGGDKAVYCSGGSKNKAARLYMSREQEDRIVGDATTPDCVKE